MKLQTARGVADVAPEEKIVKNKVVDTLREVFELYGFAPLETPVIERYETLTAKFAAGTGSEIMKEIFKLRDQGGRKLGLRYDLTVPLARFVAMNPNLRMPFKRYEMGVVFRDGPIKAGRARQFWQCDVDTIGSSSMLADAEIISLLETAFNKLGLDVVIKVNNRKLLNGILEEVGIKKKEEAIIAIDKSDKIGEGGVKKELAEKGFESKKINALLKLLKVKSLNALKIKNKEGLEGIKELEELFGYLKKMGVKKVEFDVSLARGLAYYTGTVFEVFLRKGKISGSLAAGGRWDEMIGRFMGGSKLVPAVGVAFGLVPMMEALKEKKEFKEKTLAQVYVISIKTGEKSLEIISKLREGGVKADFDLVGRGVSKNLEYASALGIPYVVFVGERELKEGKVKLRDMETGEERLLKVKDVVKKLK